MILHKSIQFEPVTETHTELLHDYYLRYPPKSNVYVAYLNFINDENGNVGPDDIRFIMEKSGEALSLPEFKFGAILNFSKIGINKEQLQVISTYIKAFEIPYAIIVNKFIASEILDNIPVFIDIALAFGTIEYLLKKYRNDRGVKLKDIQLVKHPVLKPFKPSTNILINKFIGSSGTKRNIIGLCTVIGTYNYGSAGDDDSRYIKFNLNQFCHFYLFSHLIVDLRQLDYRWGDDLSVHPINFEGKTIFLLNPEQKQSFAYHLREEEMFFFETEAIDHLLQEKR